MLVKRLKKQLAYALGFLAFWVLIIGGPVTLLRDRPPRSTPTPAPTSFLQPIEVQSVDVIQHEGTVDVVARLHNPNARAGVVHYVAAFILSDSANKEILRVPTDSHILPGSVQYISALNIPLRGNVAKVTLSTPESPVYANLTPSITLPSFSTFLLERQEIRQGGDPFAQQKGVVTNNSAFDWQYVEVTAIAFDGGNTAIGVGTTFVGRLTAGERREFTIQWPATAVPTARVVTLATTNIFREDNIIRAVGDPNQLR
jgi:hypothetical protein